MSSNTPELFTPQAFVPELVWKEYMEAFTASKFYGVMCNYGSGYYRYFVEDETLNDKLGIYRFFCKKEDARLYANQIIVTTDIPEKDIKVVVITPSQITDIVDSLDELAKLTKSVIKISVCSFYDQKLQDIDCFWESTYTKNSLI